MCGPWLCSVTVGLLSWVAPAPVLSPGSHASPPELKLTVKIKDVVRVTPPPVAVTVIELLPAEVVANVLIVSVVVHVGLHDAGE